MPMIVKYVKTSTDVATPTYATPGSAALDLRVHKIHAWDTDQSRIQIATGLHIALPPGTAMLILPRSGLAKRYGLVPVNSPGLIDSDYRGEIMLEMKYDDWWNAFERTEVIRAEIVPGARVAQAMIVPYLAPQWEATGVLDTTERGHGGFGSTGVGG